MKRSSSNIFSEHVEVAAKGVEQTRLHLLSSCKRHCTWFGPVSSWTRLRARFVAIHAPCLQLRAQKFSRPHAQFVTAFPWFQRLECGSASDVEPRLQAGHPDAATRPRKRHDIVTSRTKTHSSISIIRDKDHAAKALGLQLGHSGPPYTGRVNVGVACVWSQSESCGVQRRRHTRISKAEGLD
jgi:hypothetical protein